MADAAGAAQRSPWRVVVALWRMARPSQLALILLVYALGISMATGLGMRPDGGTVIRGAVALLPTAASVHYVNEYADYETDALTTRTPFSGGSGALVETGLPRRSAVVAAVVSGVVGIGVALVTGIAGTPAGGLLLVIFVVGWQYSVPPLQLAWRGFGAVANAVLGGVVLPLYGYATVAGPLTGTAALATLPFALVVFVNLLETTWPDREADAAVGKRTLVVRWPARTVHALYVIGSLAAAGTAVVLRTDVLPRRVARAALVPMVGLVWGIARFTGRETPLPAVVTMVLVAVSMTAAWLWVAVGRGTVTLPVW
jgi:1,4-dihydroxy-2-naphthoate octaprenyltransferase